MKSKIVTRCTFGSQKQNLLVENKVCNYNNNDKIKIPMMMMVMMTTMIDTLFVVSHAYGKKCTHSILAKGLFRCISPSV